MINYYILLYCFCFVIRQVKQYSKCDLVEIDKPLFYRAQSFQFVLCLIPPTTATSATLTSIYTSSCDTENAIIKGDDLSVYSMMY